MKSKNILKEIRNSLRLIKTYKKKGESIVSEKTSNLFKEHVKKHDYAVGLRNEIASLQTAVKSKKKELSNLMKDLSQSRKTARKALKKSNKSITLEKILVVENPSPKAVVPKRNKKGNPPQALKKKTTKTST